MANIRFLDQVSLASFQGSDAGGSITGSLLLTASAVLNDITFTKGNGDTFIVTVDTGSGTTDTGSLLTTGSFSDPILTFTKGDNSTFDINISAITSSLVTTGSVSGNTLTFTKGNGDTFELTVDTGSSGGGSIDTGSFYISSSVVNNVITFTQGDGTTETITVDTGSGTTDTGSLLVTGSVSSNTITLEKGDGSTFDLTVDTGSAVSVDTGSFYISSSVDLNTITFTQGDGTTESVTIDTGSGTTDTGSLLTTASAANNDITFTKGNGDTFVVTVDTGSGTTDTGSLLVTGSVSSNIITLEKGDGSTFDLTVDTGSGTTDTGSLLVTGSVSSNTITLEKGDGTTFDLTVDTGSGVATDTGSLLTTASAANNDITFTKGDGSTFIVTVDTGSGVATDTGSLLTTASISDATITFDKGDGSQFTIEIDNVSSSISASYATTASFVQNAQTASFTPNAVVSGTISDNTITFDYGDGTTFEIDSVANTSGDNAFTGSNTFSGSQVFTGSLLPEATSDGNGIFDLGSVSQPWREAFITTSSLKFVKDGVVVSTLNGEENAIRVGNVLITTGSLSFVDSTGDVISTIAEAQYSGSEPVGGNILETGSLLITGSVSSNTITLEKGDGTTFDLTVDTGSGGGGSTDTGSLLTTASAANNVITFTKGDASTFEVTVETGSGGDVSYDGDRVVSQDLFPTMFSASFNAGTTGSITDFLNAVFFPNNPPTITANTFSIDEFQPSGSTVGTVTATDPEGQSLTFTTQSSYTDDFFRINSSSGVITANALVTSSINTDTSQGYSASLFPITVTDTFGSETDGNVYIRVIANQAPVFREDSVSGNIISSFTSSLNENSTSGSKAQIYYTDPEGDTITIETGSGVLPSGSFELQISGTFVRLVQTTGSLDYEGITQYTYVLTASDEHYPSEDDNSISYLPAIIDVVDNIAPTVNNQTLTGVTESSAGGTSAGTISVTEPEGDVVTFTNFNLISLALDGTPVSTGSYTGTGQNDPTEDAFQVDSSGVVSRRNSVFINSDLINSYVYRVSVRDNFNETTSSGEITIPIGDDQAPSLNGVQAFYLIESAVSGANVYDSVNGRSGTTARFTSNQSVTFTVSSSADFGVDTSGYLTIAKDISGSSIISGDTISGEITASNSFGTTNQASFTVNITENFPATASFTNQSGDWNTNEAITGVNLVSVTITDPESNTPYSMSLSGPGASALTAVPQNANSSSYEIQAASNLTASTYGYTASVVDNFNKSQSYERTITIAQAGTGTLTTNGTFYVIESAISGNLIYISGSGYSGTQADLGVSYSPNYGSQVVQSFTSSNAQIAVTTAGALSLDQNISGSGTGSGDTITSDITFRDQYDNIGSGSITINVSLNLPPDATLNLGDSSLLTSSYAVSGSVIASLTGSDVQELDNIVSAALTGTDAGKFELQNASSEDTTRRYEIQPTASLETGTYSITGSVTDSFGKTGSANLDITIVDVPAIPEVYIYSSTRGQGAPLPAQYNSVLGTTTTAGSPLAEWASGSLGNEGPITLTGGVMRLIGSASAGAGGSDLNTLISSTIGAVNPTENEAGNHLIYIVYPSGSDDPRLTGVPSSTTDAFGGSTEGEYVMYYFTNASDKGIVGSQIDDFTLSTGYTASNGDIKTDYTSWTVFGCNNSKFSSTSTTFYIVPSSGSAPA